MSIVPDPVDLSLGRLLRLAQVADPQRLVETVSMTVAEIGGDDVALYLVDVDHTRLTEHPHSHGAGAAGPQDDWPDVVPVEGSMPGRVLTSGRPLASSHDDGWHVWVPVVERSEQLGVLALRLPVWDERVESFCVELGLVTAHLLHTANDYTDQLTRLRRRKHMSLAAEMQWALLPPLACSIGETTITGLLEPAYDVGGDAFDYALNGDDLELAVFDSQGHGVRSAELASLTVAAYRNERRSEPGRDLGQLVTTLDAVIGAHVQEEEFVAALVARLDITTGRLAWVSAGHPLPVQVRRGHVLPEPPAEPSLPLGLGLPGGPAHQVVRADLQSGDALLLYTDGVTDAEDRDGHPFGEERLRDLLEREPIEGRTPAEVLRRLVQSVLGHVGGRLRDDASMLYLHWGGPVPTRRL